MRVRVMSKPIINLIFLENSAMCRDMLETAVKNPNFTKIAVVTLDDNFADELNEMYSESKIVSAIYVMSEVSAKELMTVKEKLFNYEIKTIGSYILNLDLVESAQYSTVKKLAGETIELAIIINEVFKESLIESKGRFLWVLPYYQSEIRANNGIHSAYYTGLERFIRSSDRALQGSNVKTITYHLKNPSSYSSLLKYENIIKMLLSDLV